MQKASLFILVAAASFAVGAQQQNQRSPGTEQQQTRKGQTTQGADSKTDETVIDRARVDGSAGGTAPVPPEKRKAVGAGAGPHLHDTQPSPQKLPRDEPVAPSK